MGNHNEILKIVHCQKCDCYIPSTDTNCPICGSKFVLLVLKKQIRTG